MRRTTRNSGLRRLSWTAGALAALGAVAAVEAQTVKLNEALVSHTGTDNMEFVEVYTVPGSVDLTSYTLVVIEGDSTSNRGALDRVTALTGSSAAAGFYVLGDNAVVNVNQMLGTSNAFENDSETILLVQNYVGPAQGMDIDTDDDGVVDVGVNLGTIVDAIGLTDGGAMDFFYFGATVFGPDGTFLPAGCARNPDGMDTNSASDFCLVSFALDGTDGDAIPTPGASNSCAAPLAIGGLSLTQVDQSIDITLNGTLSGAGTLTFRIISAPANGSLNQSGTPITTFPFTLSGTVVTYVPNAGFSGLDSFQFDATNGQPPPGFIDSPDVAQEVGVQQNTVVITEIMHSPNLVDDIYEYVEIYNNSGSAVTLVRLDTLASTTVVTTDNLASVTIPANSYRILAPSAGTAEDETFRCNWNLLESNIIRVPNTVAMDQWENINTGSRVLLFGAGGTLLDAVDLNEPAFPDPAQQPEGESLEIDTLFLGGNGINTDTNDSGIIWAAASDLSNTGNERTANTNLDFASPGFVPATTGNPGTGPFSPAPSCFGSCCLPNGTCNDAVAPAECEADCGDWTQGGTCSPGSCSADPVGQCCTPGGSCLVISICECDAFGGIFDAKSTSCEPNPCTPSAFFINEIDYDQVGTDTAEYVEILGPGGTNLAGWSLVFYNGATGASYLTVALTAIPADGFLVVGAATVPNVDITFVAAQDSIQNGAPDGIALVDNTGAVLDIVGYEGTFVGVGGPAGGMTFPDIGVADVNNEERSLQRIPDGAATWQACALGTPGESNTCIAATGACCGEMCEILTQADCESVKGATYQGDDTICGPATCVEGCTTIAAAKASGDGLTVTLCNAVISSTTDLISSASNRSFQMQDATGGITVFGDVSVIDPILAQVGEGDQIDLTGVTDTFNGLFEIGAPFSGLNDDGPVGIPTPANTVPADWQNGSPTAEGFESKLVVLECVTFQESGNFAGLTNYTVSADGGSTLVSVRISTEALNLVGTAIPTESVTLTGIFSQSNFNMPVDGGYQLLLRSTADITSCAPPLLVDIALANPPTDNPFVAGVQPYRDVLQNRNQANTVDHGIGAVGTPNANTVTYSPVSVTFSGTPSVAPAPGNITVSCTGGSCPTVTGVSGSGAGPYLLMLSGVIPAKNCTTLTFAGTNVGQKLQYQALPGDVNMNGTVGATDTLALVNAINVGVPPPATLPVNLPRYDINRTGGVSAADVLREVQLLNGVNTTEPFLGDSAATCP